MNAKKIMGAVLVALLAAALFVGAGAAADKDAGTVFVYQDNTGLETGVWTSADGIQITVDQNKGVYPGANFVPGTYKYNGTSVYVTYPTATYSVVGLLGVDTQYIVANGGNVYADSKLTITITPAAKGVEYTHVMVGDQKYDKASFLAAATNKEFSVADESYEIKAIFDENAFVDGTPENLFLDTVNTLTYNVVEADDATISASVDTVYQNEKITLVVKGTPGTKYYFNGTGFDIVASQYVDTFAGAPYGKYFVMPNVGEASLKAEITDAKEAVITLMYEKTAGTVVDVKNGEIKIKVSAPVVTATLGADSYFIGQDIEITGTSTAKYTFEFTISGTNIKETDLTVASDPAAKWGKSWEATLNAPVGLDVGTYTIKIYQGDNVVATVPVALKQPFISIIEAPEVVVQGEKAEFLINAESATKIQAYVFGTNYFDVFGGELADDEILNEFEVVIDKDTTTNMSAGQYFVVFQHPMYNGIYNIFEDATTEGKIVLNTTAKAETQPTTGDLLFNVKDRQTANAAQALCDALDSQNIDDMYVKYSFFIVGQDEAFTMSEIPSTIAQGETLTISGVSTANEGQTVTVEMISTAFAAIPKENVGSAAFIVATAKIAEDGTWEVTLDTSDLNVDEYSISVACSNVEKPWKNTKINVVEAADKPDTPVTPPADDEPGQDEPVAPETPGFGALAALAGLGAVAVLLLRRE